MKGYSFKKLNFQKYTSKRVEVFLVLKPEEKERKKELYLDEMLNKWFGYFPEIETDDVRYNPIIGKE